MTRDEIVELAAGYALGALDAPERESFEALLRAGDVEATAALREFEGTLADLAVETADAPPPAVRAALLARIETQARPSAATSTAAQVVPIRERRRRAFWPAMAAAAAAAGVAAIIAGMAVSTTYERRLAGLSGEAAGLRREIDQLKGQIAEQRTLLALLGDPAAQVVVLAGQPAAPQAQARMIWSGRAGGLLLASGLPAPPEGKTYQLWAIAGKAAPVPAGTFGTDAEGSGRLRVPRLQGVDAVDVFAVTLEPAGGLPAPSGPMILVGKS